MTGDLIDGEQSVVYGIGEDERSSEAVVRAVADRTRAASLELDPLYGTVNPKHVDSGSRAGVAFEYVGCSVTERKVRARVREAGGR